MTVAAEAATTTAPPRHRPLVVHLCAVEYTARVLLRPQMSALVRDGYDVRVACAPHGLTFDPALEQFGPIDVRFPRSPHPGQMASAAIRWARIVRELRPDVVHLHTPSVALTSRLLPRSVLPAQTRVVYTVHGFAHVWDDMTRRDRMLERVERALAGRTDLMLFQSEEDLSHARRLGYRARLMYLGNGVEEDWFTLPSPERGRGALQLLYVGRLIREKGLLDLFDALVHAPNVHLTLAGAQLPTDRDGVEAEILLRAARSPLAGRVSFVGQQSRDEMRKRVQDAHALVLPSYREGVPRCLIEGMAAGRPAVATDVRGSRALVKDGVTGYLVPARSPAALATAMEALAALPEERFVAMSVAARQLAADKFRESDVIERLERAYEAIGVRP